MDGIKESFLRRIEEMWDATKLKEFVEDCVSGYEYEVGSPLEVKGSFLTMFHEELGRMADAMAGPFEEYRRLLERSARPTLLIKGPISQKDFEQPGRIIIPEGCDVEWYDQKKIEEMLNFPEHEELVKEMARITQEIYEETKIRDRQAGGDA